MSTSTKRDVTRALNLAQALFDGEDDGAYNPAKAQELIQILKNLDARTGRRDPSIRKPKKKTPAKRTSRR